MSHTYIDNFITDEKQFANTNIKHRNIEQSKVSNDSAPFSAIDPARVTWQTLSPKQQEVLLNNNWLFELSPTLRAMCLSDTKCAIIDDSERENVDTKRRNLPVSFKGGKGNIKKSKTRKTRKHTLKRKTKNKKTNKRRK